ncbi:hypothetical protein QCA50_006274 [Cerrena zonata]|uniref:Golgi apparatus membrane protein TVP38 n=1 Tax=Cerrena zonata TaxID=2478898 RepID=A0AAW0GNT7_9APHY
MANPYQAYGTNIPSLSYANATTNKQSQYPPHNQFATNYQFRPSGPQDRPGPKREDSDASKDGDTTILMREVLTRTPSPTPEEAAELKQTSVFDWKAMSHWRYWIRKEWRWHYLVGTIIMICVILFVVYHKQIVDWLHPAAVWVHDVPAGWLIPIVIFVIISFPPLFGHEILGILCGLVWGLGVGFVIVAAGTFLGEMANFYAFRYCCSARGEKYERKNLSYAYLVRVVRDGGFKIALIARFSAIPGHFTTAVFSTCGMNVWVFAAAAFFSLPKQFLTVYLGVALEQSENGQTSTTDKIIKGVVIGITTVVTILAMWWVYRKMNQVKPTVIYERRKARQAKLNAANGSTAYLNAPNNFSTASVFNPNASTSSLPLGSRRSTSPEYQQWDSEGRAVNYAPDPTLYAPQPKRPARMPSSQPGSRTDSPAQMSERERPFGVSWTCQARHSEFKRFVEPPARK